MNNKCSSNSRNCSIDIFRIIFATYVVALHSTPASLDAHPFLSVTILSFFRFSVPFFFMVSGYYFFKKANEITFKDLYANIKKIIVTYVFWSCLYFIINFIKWGHLSLTGFLYDCVYSFFISGSYYHLWYFPALICATCVSALFCKFGLRKILFCISISVYPLCYLILEHNLLSFIHTGYLPAIIKGVSILQPLAQGLFYFCCGQLINIFYGKCASKEKSRILVYILPISVILWFAVIWCNFFFSIGLDLAIIFGIYINVGLIVLVLLLNPLPKYPVAAKKCRFLANFVYYSHPIFRYMLDLVNKHCFHFSDYWNFPITIILTIATGLVLYRINNKYINRFIG